VDGWAGGAEEPCVWDRAWYAADVPGRVALFRPEEPCVWGQGQVKLVHGTRGGGAMQMAAVGPVGGIPRGDVVAPANVEVSRRAVAGHASTLN